MPLSKKRIMKELLRAAAEFHALRPWEQFLNEDIVALRIPGEEHPALASIMGAAGEEFGLTVLLGEDAPARLVRTISEVQPADEIFEDDHLVAFSMTPLGEIAPWARELLELGGFQGRRETPAPWLLAKRPGHNPRRPDRDQLELLLFATRGLVHALDEDLVEPRPLEPGNASPLLTLDGDPRSPDVAAGEIVLPTGGTGAPPPPVEIPAEVARLPRRDTVWHVGYPVLPANIENDDRTVRALLVLDTESGLLLQSRVVANAVEVGNEFYGTVLDPRTPEIEPHLPREILSRSRALVRLLAPSLETLDVGIRYEKDLPELDEAIDDLAGHLAGGDLRVPDADDLEAWKEADRLFSSRIHEFLGVDAIFDPRNLARFFGSAKTGRKLFEERFDEGAGPSYLEWLLARQRPDPVGPRTGERILAGGFLTPVERILLRNRLRGRVGVYRFDELEPEGRVALVDVLDGSRHVIRDFSLASNERVIDTCAPMQIFRAGQYRFGSLLGPALTAELVDEALDFLDRQVGPLTPDRLAADPAAIGRLWQWSERAGAKPPTALRLINADRHTISIRETTWTADDPTAVAEALLAVDGFEAGEEGILWIGAIGDDGPLGPGRILRGRVTFDSRKIVAEANSVERMAELREHVERAAGLGRGTERDITPPDVRPPAAGGRAEVRDVVFDSYVQPADDPESARETLVRRTLDHYLNWVDSPIPALGDRTPRELCESEEGRRRVRRRILAMPCPPGLREQGLELPRDEMLAALDLSAKSPSPRGPR